MRGRQDRDCAGRARVMLRCVSKMTVEQGGAPRNAIDQPRGFAPGARRRDFGSGKSRPVTFRKAKVGTDFADDALALAIAAGIVYATPAPHRGAPLPTAAPGQQADAGE